MTRTIFTSSSTHKTGDTNLVEENYKKDMRYDGIPVSTCACLTPGPDEDCCRCHHDTLPLVPNCNDIMSHQVIHPQVSPVNAHHARIYYR